MASNKTLLYRATVGVLGATSGEQRPPVTVIVQEHKVETNG